jgi:hypothetical protein
MAPCQQCQAALALADEWFRDALQLSGQGRRVEATLVGAMVLRLRAVCAAPLATPRTDLAAPQSELDRAWHEMACLRTQIVDLERRLRLVEAA